MNQWVSVGKFGLRYREHPERTTGVGKRKRPLRYYTAVYKWQGKTVTDAYGWEGEDFHNEDDVVETALVLRQNRKAMTPPFTLKELIEEREQVIEAKAEQVRQEQLQEEREKTTRLDQVFAQYCESHSHKKSLENEIGLYRNWIGPAVGGKRLDEIILLDLERIKRKMTTAGKSPRTIQYIKSIVRQIYSYASIRGMYDGTPPTQHFLKKQRLDNKRQRYLTPDEANALLETIRPHSEQTYNICLLSLNTGMRFGEIASLRWQHINFDSMTILIVDPKNGESRNAYMTDAVVQMFTGMERGKPDGIVFPARTGGKMAAASKAFFRAVDRIGLNDGITDRRMKVVFHSLRHSCASWLVNAGVELPTIAKVLGHKSLEMTARYSHVNDTSVRNAMRTIDHQQAQAGKVVNLRSGNGKN
jgi:integrase